MLNPRAYFSPGSPKRKARASVHPRFALRAPRRMHSRSECTTLEQRRSLPLHLRPQFAEIGFELAVLGRSARRAAAAAAASGAASISHAAVGPAAAVLFFVFFRGGRCARERDEQLVFRGKRADEWPLVALVPADVM